MINKHRSRVVIADDHPIFLDGLTNLIQAASRLEVVARCSDGAAALQAVRDNRPDLAVLDMSMPHLSGLDVLEALRADRIPTQVVFLTASANDEQLLAAVEKGASAVLLKDTVAGTLLECLETVLSGTTWHKSDFLKDAASRESQRRQDNQRVSAMLTPRERELIMLVAEGLSNKEIARRANVTEGTIKLHLHNIYSKLGVANRTALTRVALALRDKPQ
jgi:two-component system nitrate/nitrite response regulator NarL